MKQKQFLSFKFIEKNYNKIKYKGTSDRNWHFLNKLYPIIISVKNSPNKICLDTGGQMAGCHFGIYQFTKNAIYSEGKKITDIKFIK